MDREQGTTGDRSGRAPRIRWTDSWHQLVESVLDQNLCTGCSGCILACPRDVLTLDLESWQPQLSEKAQVGLDPTVCIYQDRGCTMCARACPRLGAWEQDADIEKWGREHAPEEVLGVHQGIFLIAAQDPAIAEAGQDGGLATAMLAYALEHDYIDAALVSYVDDGLVARPGVARNRDELLAAAGSRYTYSPNTLAFESALAIDGVERLGLVSVGCQTSIPAVASAHGARKVARRFELTIGLLCSSTFDERIYDELIEGEYGVERSALRKVNIKGRMQLWTDSETSEPDVEIPLKKCHPFQRAGCGHCPDFTAEHADISLGGIGKDPGATLTIIRSDLAASLVRDMESRGLISVRDARTHDPAAVELITKLARKQRRRWPASGPNGGDVSTQA